MTSSKNLWHDSNYIVHVFMWPKFGNSRISVSEVMTTHFYKDLTKKTAFLRDGLGSSSMIRDWHYVQTWSFTPVWKKGHKVSKFWGLIPKFVEVTGKKLVEAPPPPRPPTHPLFWIGLSRYMDTNSFLFHISLNFLSVLRRLCLD